MASGNPNELGLTIETGCIKGEEEIQIEKLCVSGYVLCAVIARRGSAPVAHSFGRIELVATAFLGNLSFLGSTVSLGANRLTGLRTAQALKYAQSSKVVK